jgi:hypothetical protein
VAKDFVVLGKASHRLLRIDPIAIDHDVEDAVATADQLGVEVPLFLDTGRQTGGLGKKVSGAAVLDRNFHDPPFAAR